MFHIYAPLEMSENLWYRNGTLNKNDLTSQATYSSPYLMLFGIVLVCGKPSSIFWIPQRKFTVAILFLEKQRIS